MCPAAADTGQVQERARRDHELELWLAAARRNDQAGFTGLYRCLAGRVAGYLRGRGVTDPDDVTNEVFLGAFGKLGGFDGGAADFRSWLFAIASNKASDWHRRRARRPQVQDASESVLSTLGGGDVEAESMELLGRSAVGDMLDHLTPDQRDVLLLRIVAELTLEETAQALGKPVGAVKALQHRAIAALRRNLGEAVSPEAGPTITGVR